MAHQLIALARAARGGDRPALESLLRETASFLHALARARVGDTHAAEVVTADALTRIASGLARLRDPQAYPHWAYRILQRCIARRGGRPRPTRDSALADLAARGPGPVDVAVELERAHVIRVAMVGLPGRLREPLLLHFVCGLAYREIATVLGTGTGTVARRMKKALSLLRARLGDIR
ncbi:MAG: sigma-70 family RNA polymerase sigma factor [Planctomycetota bacterium]|nr:sigma-70 family RNA polymerase sigma factor [Planctomycetota bacterium]